MPHMSLDGSGIGQFRQAAIVEDISVARRRRATNFSDEFLFSGRTAGYDLPDLAVRPL
ncbi:hypothetical protein [Schlesneria paludicola]|uniref:hypothetical protein n=1 Tax=Schlesneria paludicola TaxID=360056 RepID=UPI0002F5B84E|nr:hypothetical protein [Schlesneria paludicola]